MTSFAEELRKNPQPETRTGPLWEGPGGVGPQGGITQGLLGRYLTCKERFRVQTMEGLGRRDAFEAPLEFGNLWHAAEEGQEHSAAEDAVWGKTLENYARKLCVDYPFHREEITHWYEKVKVLFPEYLNYWSKHPDMTDATREILFRERVFSCRYVLPSQRVVRLRGKFDGGDIAGKQLWLWEHKTKSQIDRQKIERQLGWDLQVNFYLIALAAWQDDSLRKRGWQGSNKKWRNLPVAGVRYNVVRRAAHKSAESMMEKVAKDLKDGRGDEWFLRFNVEVSNKDTDRFRRECLDPVLENLYDDWEWWQYCLQLANRRPAPAPFPAHPYLYNFTLRTGEFPHHHARHFRLPYYYDPVRDGGSGDLDEYLNSGSRAGLSKLTTLFGELEGGK